MTLNYFFRFDKKNQLKLLKTTIHLNRIDKNILEIDYVITYVQKKGRKITTDSDFVITYPRHFLF
jgi:hypothetical protein